MKTNLKILFRTSGGKSKKKELGMGHVFRCLNLASELKRSKVFLLVEDYGGVKKILKEKKLSNVNFLEKNISYISDLEKTKKIIKKWGIDIIIVDKYNVNFQYVKELKKIISTVIITDLKKNNYNADLLINGFIGYDNKIKFNKYKTKCLLGPKYQILNSKFQIQKVTRKKYDIIVTFGGYDEYHISEKILKILNSRDIKLKTKMILGPAKEMTPVIKEFMSKKYSWLKILKKTDNMKKNIAESKIGLCSGGLTTYEMAALNVPFGIICQVKHQLITAREWQKLNCGINLGLGTEFNIKKFEDFLEKINLKNTSRKKIIDGYGASRVIKEILKIYEEKREISYISNNQK